jgi:uncharacterized membrane protein YdjX (TVP38/TMEM64 family)
MSDSWKRSGAVRRLPMVLAVLAAVLFLALGGLRFVTLDALADNARWLRETAHRWEHIAPILFITANALMLTMLVIPAWFCTILSGVLFGLWLGAAYAVIGTTLGAICVFLAARTGVGGLVERAGPRAAGIAAGFRDDAFKYLLVLRLVPLFPFTLVNIASALGGLPVRTYVLGTLVGIIPSVLIYASIGDVFMDLAAKGQLPDTNLLRQPKFVLPLLGLALLALLPILVRRWRR